MSQRSSVNSPLQMLRSGLAQFGDGLQNPNALSDAAEMSRVRELVQRAHCSAAAEVDADTISSTVIEFRRTGTIRSFRELKHICYGIVSIDESGWCVLVDRKLRPKVFSDLAGQADYRKRLRCFQALLSSYWAFPLYDDRTTQEIKAQWKWLQHWLTTELHKLLSTSSAAPSWLECLARNAELFSDQPCEKFGSALLIGDSEAFRQVMEELSIPNNSWIIEETVLAQIRSGTALPDEAFGLALPHLVRIAKGGGGFDIGGSIKNRSIGLLVSRYARCKDHPEKPMLRDAAISLIGNPWLRRSSWDAYVVDQAGKPDDRAREMVNGWLKRRLITDFFELLSADGLGDRRRVEYWLRFEPLIEDMWFALGFNAQNRKGSQFSNFKTRARGRLLDLALEGTTADNNAFVMRIGDYLAIEFGSTDNAFFLFRWDTLKQKLSEKLSSGLSSEPVHISELKASNRLARLIHRDSNVPWEEKFDAEIRPLLGSPFEGRFETRTRQSSESSRNIHNDFSQKAFGAFVETYRLQIDDKRAVKGALWVVGDNHPRIVIQQLTDWGFRRRHPRGWYKE
jgi:EH_Signature domain